MSTSKLVTGYCPICQQNVLLKRQKMDFCIALMLLIFTGGIGLIFYYFAREKNTCVHCGSLCNFQIPDAQKEIYSTESTEIKGIKFYHCPYCGTEIDKQTKGTCPNCGSEIQN